MCVCVCVCVEIRRQKVDWINLAQEPVCCKDRNEPSVFIKYVTTRTRLYPDDLINLFISFSVISRHIICLLEQ